MLPTEEAIGKAAADLLTKAERCFDMAEVQRDAADKQRELAAQQHTNANEQHASADRQDATAKTQDDNADKLTTLGISLEVSAANLLGETQVRPSPAPTTLAEPFGQPK
jgi:hypothetical protein